MAAGWRLAWPGRRGSGESLQAIAVVQDGENGGLHQIEGGRSRVGERMDRNGKDGPEVKEGQE